MAQETILVVDDEKNIRDLTKLYLEKEGYNVETAADGLEAVAKARALQPSLMVLDVMLPEIDGFEVLKRVRAEGDLPVIMLTARDDDIDQIIGLEIGADDYMTKPFNPRVLVAQVKAVLRRSSADTPTADTPREVGNLVMNPAARTTRVNGKLVELRAKEFDLLLTLIDNANRVLSRDQLLDLVWGYDYYGQTRTVDVHVAHLRDKLSESDVVIETVWGKGYKLVS